VQADCYRFVSQIIELDELPQNVSIPYRGS
jgi:hypothetical protein